MEDHNPIPENREEETEIIFTNHQLDSAKLPNIHDIQYEPIPKKLMYVNMIVLGILALIIIAGMILLFIFVEKVRPYFFVITGFVAAILALLFFAEIKGFKYIGYAVREHDIMYRHGWLWQSQIFVPFNRIQHMEVDQGPIDRLFDLANLILYTAGGSEVEIEGLTPDQAQSIKTYIMDKTQNLKITVPDDESE